MWCHIVTKNGVKGTTFKRGDCIGSERNEPITE